MFTPSSLRWALRLPGAGRRRPAARRGTRLALEDLESRLVLSTDPYLYAASFGTNTIQRFEELSGAPAPRKNETDATFVKPNSGGVNNPLGVILGPQDHDLYVTSLQTNQVLRYSGKNGKFLGVFIDSSLGVLHNPSGILFGPDGNIYVANAQPATSNVVYFDPQGNYLGVYAQLPTTRGATGMVFGPDGKLYISTRLDNAVVRTDGTTIEEFVNPGDGGLSRTAGMVFGPDGNFYVASENTHNVLEFDRTGTFIREFVTAGSGGLQTPAGILFGPYGDLYVADEGPGGTGAILHYNGVTGAYINTLVSQQADPSLAGPRQIFFGNTNPTTLNYVPRRWPSPPGNSKYEDLGTSLVTSAPAASTTLPTPAMSVGGVSSAAFVRGVTWDVGSHPSVASTTALPGPAPAQVDAGWILDDGAIELLAQSLFA